MNKNKLTFLSLLFLASCIFFSCATVTGSSSQTQPSPHQQNLTVTDLCPLDVQWQEIEPGFLQTSHKVEKLGIKWTCVKIDLTNPNLDIIPGITISKKGLKTNDFASKMDKTLKAVVTVNATPFDVDNYKNIVGVVKSNGVIMSKPVERYCALTFNKTDTGFEAGILENQIPEEIKEVDSAFGGFFQILHNNEINYNFGISRRSRSGCGISQDKKQLYILVNTAGLSLRDRNGLTYPECALILQYLGCTEAMEFDGGHSTGLSIYKKQVMKPFFQRKIPVALGFFTN